MSTVRFAGKDLPMASNIGERSIEIPIIREWWRVHGGPHVVEVGAVTPYWWDHQAGEIGQTHRDQSEGSVLLKVPHAVVDPHDPYPFAIRHRALEVDYTKRAVLCCSTLEHIGMDFSAPGGPGEALTTLARIAIQAEHYMITWPTGHHPMLDEMAAHAKTSDAIGHEIFMYKQVRDHEYELMETPDFSLGYGHPFPWGNGIVFVTNWDVRP